MIVALVFFFGCCWQFFLLVGRARQTVASFFSLSLYVYVEMFMSLKKNIRLYFFCSLGSFFFLFFCTLITDCDEMISSKTYAQRDEIKQRICKRKIQKALKKDLKKENLSLFFNNRLIRDFK